MIIDHRLPAKQKSNMKIYKRSDGTVMDVTCFLGKSPFARPETDEIGGVV